MNLNTILSEIEQLLALVREWQSNSNVPEIEREIALDRLKALYASMKKVEVLADDFSENLAHRLQPAVADRRSFQGVFYEIADETPAPKKAPAPAAASSVIENLVIPEFPLIVGRRNELVDEKELSAEDAAPMLDEISSLAGFINSNAQPADLIEIEPTPEAALEPVLEVAPAVEEPEVKPSPEQQKVALEPKRDAKTLSDSISLQKQLLNETIASKSGSDLAHKLQQKPLADLRKAISFNDKFQMIKELFAGDAAAYERTITELNGMETLDAAIIYIQENYQWDTSSVVANHLIELLQRKLA